MLLPKAPFEKKYSGTPTNAPIEKQINCLFVRFAMTFVFILDKSFGTLTDIAT